MYAASLVPSITSGLTSVWNKNTVTSYTLDILSAPRARAKEPGMAANRNLVNFVSIMTPVPPVACFNTLVQDRFLQSEIRGVPSYN